MTFCSVKPYQFIQIQPQAATLEMDNPIVGELIIDIFGDHGGKILNIKFFKETLHFKTQIDLSGQAGGVYLIDLFLEKYNVKKKLILE